MKIESNGYSQEPHKNSNVWSVIKNISRNVNQEEAFYVCDISEIIEKHKEWKLNLPRVVPYYAVKCNDDITVLEVLAALGTCFDCASKVEINKVLSIGVSSDRIIFANPAKPLSHIRYAASVGVSTMTFDNESELYKIQDIYPGSKLVLRIRIDAADAQCPLGMKFGCNPIKEAPRLLRKAKSLNLNVIGISFHVGSGCREPAVFERAIAAARELFNYAATLGFHFSMLDIGGGYPGVRGTSIVEIANVTNKALDQHFNDLVDVQVIAEPGRYYVTRAYTLTCNIYSIRKLYDEDERGHSFETHRMYYINDGVYGSFNCILYDHRAVTPIPLNEHAGSKRILSSIWGPTCDALDQVIEEVSLPDLNIGDWIVFEDMGAYTLPVASPFNGFPIPEVFYVANREAWEIVKDSMKVTGDNIHVMDGPTSLDKLYSPKKSTPTKPITIAGICFNDIVVG